MATLWDTADRAAISERINRLDAAQAPQWGQMNSVQMMSHLVESMKIAFNEKLVVVIPGKNPPAALRQAVIFSPTPWPIATLIAPAEYFTDAWDAGQIDEYRHTLHAYLQRFEQAPGTILWGRHAYFDELTTEEWGALLYKHIDHHLRQFSC